MAAILMIFRKINWQNGIARWWNARHRL